MLARYKVSRDSTMRLYSILPSVRAISIPLSPLVLFLPVQIVDQSCHVNLARCTLRIHFRIGQSNANFVRVSLGLVLTGTSPSSIALWLTEQKDPLKMQAMCDCLGAICSSILGIMCFPADCILSLRMSAYLVQTAIDVVLGEMQIVREVHRFSQFYQQVDSVAIATEHSRLTCGQGTRVTFK